jgi:hypothetical protein
MTTQKHIVIFSHGFGVEKDSLGLFTDIAKMLSSHNIESIMFDYNEINPETKEVFVKPFSEQTKILQSVIDKTCEKNPNSIIDIVAHSQGSIMVAQAKLQGIRKVISMSPFFHTDIHAVLERQKKFSASQIDFNGTSRRVRSDGTVSVVPSSYWQERFTTDIYTLYNDLALHVELTIIRAGEDKIMEGPDLLKIFNTYIISVHGDHDFKQENRKSLISVIEAVISNSRSK